MDTRSWFTIETEEENRQTTQLLRMTAAEWREEGNRIIRAWKGRDIRPCLDYLNRIEHERAIYVEEQEPAPVVVQPLSEFDSDFLAWLDMVEEPWKYGDSIVEWLDLDAKLTSGPGRWRVGAYWYRRQGEEDARQAELVGPWREIYSKVAKEAAVAGDRAWVRRDIKRHVARFRAETAERNARRAAAATRIAAAVRGHQLRTANPCLSCCLCLSHRISPVKTEFGQMCRGCVEHGLNIGVLSDPWARK
jgi:hypothetical protein